MNTPPSHRVSGISHVALSQITSTWFFAVEKRAHPRRAINTTTEHTVKTCAALVVIRWRSKLGSPASTCEIAGHRYARLSRDGRWQAFLASFPSPNHRDHGRPRVA